MTQAERKLWSALRLQQLRGFKFRRQHLLGNYVLDFVCISARLVIEVDGGQHTEVVAADDRRGRFYWTQGFACCDFGIMTC